MPRVPDGELGRYLDPESEEYSPGKGDIDEEERVADIIGHEIADIEDELDHPKRDIYSGEKNKFRGIDPETLWDRLVYLKNDYFGKVRDKKLKQQLRERFSKLEQLIYKQFIPFIDARINFYGWQNSPLEQYNNAGSRLSVDEIAEYFQRARMSLGHFKFSEEQKLDYLTNFNQLKEKLDRYRSEPTLFTFEDVEEKLQKELFKFEYGDFYFGRNKESAIVLDDENTKKEITLKFDVWLAEANSLVEIADRMLHKEIKSGCVERAKDLLNKVEYLKALSEAPRELSAIKGELKDLWQRIKNNEQVDAGRLDGLNDKLAQLKAQRLDFETRKIIDKLTKLAERLKHAQAGENLDEEDRFDVGEGNADWAWTLLGIDKNSSQEDLKKAYHSLALKYHPDFNKDKAAEDKMKKINEAVSFIKRVRGYK